MRTKTKKFQPTDLEGTPIIESPLPGTIVKHSGWSPTGPMKGFPCDVYICHGQRVSGGRISNWWTWRRIILAKSGGIALGAEESGYGSFHESKHKYEINIQIKLLKK